MTEQAFCLGCDGANSIVRRDLGIELEEGPIPGFVLLIHFKPKDLRRLHKQGRFWHIFFPNDVAAGGSIKDAIISQDNIDTWTAHLFLPEGFDYSQVPSTQATYIVLGGMCAPYPIEKDQVLVRSTWTPSIAVAKSYLGPLQRILIAGDACHQTVPTGGYGMNMGIEEAFDLG
ncbi:hypothetical protein MGYG_09012 [Nannizzia gypsea CBS 118893]|uniref:FAD-binding domain-containing protein n=1 Tax=Arthroderma gypseum (strain ATCC MYA-4604 / CBS 118893) TaxID=535722 RepID=E4URD8_ARTGP|nr:hypothetical protein MGYG_09012 [Nannizzia gypsea CBS 118893]EFR00201.1 hypothetical protein MGYG_09012 [Nannizzia gypsea CBS 118893]